MCRFFVLFFGWVFTRGKIISIFIFDERIIACFFLDIVGWFVSICLFISFYQYSLLTVRYAQRKEGSRLRYV